MAIMLSDHVKCICVNLAFVVVVIVLDSKSPDQEKSHLSSFTVVTSKSSLNSGFWV